MRFNPMLPLVLGALTVVGCGTEKEILEGKREPLAKFETHQLSLGFGPGACPPAPADDTAQSFIQPIWSKGFEGSVGLFSSAGRILSCLAMSGEHIYMMDTAGGVHAIEARTGCPLWHVPSSPSDKEGEGVLGGGVVASNDHLLVATAFGDVLSLDAQTGSPLWKSQLSAPSRTAPVVHGGRVYVTTATNQLHVLDQHSGKLLWMHSGVNAEQISFLGSAVPAVAGDIVIVAYTTGEVFALKSADGQVLWSETIAQDYAYASLPSISSRPIIADGVAYIASQSRLVALNVRTGAKLWEQPMSTVEAPLVWGELLFQITTRNQLICLERKTGKIYWIKSLPQPGAQGQRNFLGPVVLNGLLYITCTGGSLLAIDPGFHKPGSGGTIKKGYTLSGPTMLPPVVSGGTLYTLSESGEMEAFR